MSHGDQITKMPDSFVTIAKTQTAPHVAIAHESKPIYGLQFHPEVTHTSIGRQILENFVVHICHARRSWTMVCFATRLSVYIINGIY
jgi:GMP synthase (glutamine-hydrolysing)